MVENLLSGYNALKRNIFPEYRAGNFIQVTYL